MGSIHAILSLLAYAQCTLTTIFDVELAANINVVSDCLEVHLNVSKIAFRFITFYMFLLDLVERAKLVCDLLC
jgi:hypothetical protein